MCGGINTRISIFAKRYFSIPDKLYHYKIDAGITVPRKINTLEDWQKMCSSSNVFKIILSWIQNNQKYKVFEAPIMQMMLNETRLGLLIIKHSMLTEIQPQAYAIFCEMWGEGHVKRVEKKMAEQDENK